MRKLFVKGIYMLPIYSGYSKVSTLGSHTLLTLLNTNTKWETSEMASDFIHLSGNIIDDCEHEPNKFQINKVY